MKLNHQREDEIVDFLLSSPKKENCYFYPQNQQFHLQGSPKRGGGGRRGERG